MSLDLRVAWGLAAIVLSVSCEARPVPLRENAEVAARESERRNAVEFRQRVRGMSAADVAALDSRWSANPEDAEVLRQLLIHHAPDPSGNATQDQEPVVAARRRYVLWLIEHRPDYDEALRPDVRISATSRGPLADPAGFEQARALWIRHAARPDVSVQTLANAAIFLQTDDVVLAEQMWLQAQRMAPDERWSRQLGRLYARALLGEGPATLRPVSDARGTGDDVARARAALEGSRDARLLWSASEWLLRRSRSRLAGEVQAADLGRRYLERAVQLDPDFLPARRALALEQWRAGSRELRDQLVDLVARSHEDYLSAEYYEYSRRDLTKAAGLWTQSKDAANRALALAADSADHASAGFAIYGAQVALATHALREGDRRGSVRAMQQAAEATPSESFALPFILLDSRLTNGLLTAGERESVAVFLERSAALRPYDRDQLLRDARDVRNGVMPERYQLAGAR